ncbi:hypothetical protein ACIQZN_08885 [Streptomyces sp. NPDC097595]|uniref:hypothetical protein n=1 Tax=Streptomyces sp. NPDC097595 TaxID=3366090 RepID=UPI00382F8253
MSEITFELRPVITRKESGRRGLVGPYGEVTLGHTRIKWPWSAAKPLELRLHGAQVPDATYTSLSTYRPTLKAPHLVLDGTPVDMSFKSCAFRKKDRVLRLSWLDRTYDYTVTGMKKGAVLRRPGVEITTERRKNPAGKGLCSWGTATGECDAIDLALAVLFEEVDTFELTTYAAMSEVFNKVTTPRRPEPMD